MDYLRVPAAIYEKSFATIRSEVNFSRFSADAEPLIMRLVHACGMVDIVDDLVIAPNALAAGRAALSAKAPIVCDAYMVAEGVIRRHIAATGNDVICAIRDPAARVAAETFGTTLSAGAIEVLAPKLEGAIVAIGNAPTALFHLLEGLDRGWAKPALILGFPVGFVGAAESKAELIANARGVPFVALRGRRGGSALAAAAVNAVAAGLST